jgi:predicted transposase YbfD/YdcC
VRDSGAVFIGQVKDNQPGLLKAVQSMCEAAIPAQSIQTKDRRRRRQEIRTVEIFLLSQGVNDPDWQALVTTVIRVRRERMDRSSRSGLWTARADEVAFYVSSAPLTAVVATAAIRGHWGIENRAHHVRDVTMAEDASRIRKNPGVLARIRSFAANILRLNGAENIRDARYRLAVGGVDPLLKCRFP